jgi:hypothetical protein
VAFISITRLRVRSWRFLPGFAFYAFGSARQAKRSEGNLGIRVMRDQRHTFWTATSWTTENAMKAFMLSGQHKPAMRKLLDWCDEASLVHWTQDSADLPSWPEAHQRLQSQGRRSKVNHPSATHTAFTIPEPHFRPGSDLRVK